jgi:hypothetical protein
MDGLKSPSTKIKNKGFIENFIVKGVNQMEKLKDFVLSVLAIALMTLIVLIFSGADSIVELLVP